MTDGKDNVHDEFLAEAQEILEALSRDLLVLDSGAKAGERTDPDLVNEIFRGIHTLKGIAGMFGHHQMATVAHALEDLLDDIRLGRLELQAGTLDVLFVGVENIHRLLAAPETGDTGVDLDEYARAVDEVVSSATPEQAPKQEYELDEAIFSVLTEYEEHRLRTNMAEGVPLYRLEVRFPLTAIDSCLEELKKQAKPFAEIITYLPRMEGDDPELVELDVLIASRADPEEIEAALQSDSVHVVPIAQSGPKDAAPEPLTRAQPLVPQAAHQEPDADLLSVRSVANSVRVDIRKLDHLMNVVGELGIVRGTVGRLMEGVRARPELRALGLELHRIHRGFERNLAELQNAILDVRMVPLRQIFDRLARVVRQIAREHGKEVRLVVGGADTEVDKLIVEELSDPLLHIIRNAVDHGLEGPKEREVFGKPSQGTIVLNASQRGNHVVIEVEDDGAGIDHERVLSKAVRSDLISAEDAGELPRQDALGFIFLPGFSTRSDVTDLSGRGVGMDVVKTNISRLGGVIDVQSTLGVGTKFTITLPITLAIIRALVVKVEGRTYCVPLTSVQEAIMLEPDDVRTVQGREVLSLRGATIPLCRLAQLFSFESAPEGARRYVIISGIGKRRMGLVVNELLGQQDVVIKPFGRSLSAVRWFAGATDLGDQQVSLVVDAPAIIEEALSAVDRTVALELRA